MIIELVFYVNQSCILLSI